MIECTCTGEEICDPCSQAEYAHETACENAWLVAAEYDPESVYEMEWQEAAGLA